MYDTDNSKDIDKDEAQKLIKDVYGNDFFTNIEAIRYLIFKIQSHSFTPDCFRICKRLSERRQQKSIDVEVFWEIIEVCHAPCSYLASCTLTSELLM